MLTTVSDLLVSANGHTPLVLLLAAILLAAAGWIGVRVFRSLQRQGARIGGLEKSLREERIRRRQTEQCVREAGIDLPYWPGDPAELHAITAARRAPTYDPLPYDDALTAEASMPTGLPPVPPFSPEERERLSRHRR
jgi:hypothetical protein